MEEYGSSSSGASLGEILGAAISQKEEKSQSEEESAADESGPSSEVGDGPASERE